MSPGKIASQAGHAYLGAAVNADPALLADYHRDFPTSPGTKVCLRSKNLLAIIQAQQKAAEAGIPHFLVVDSGCHDFFGGQPTVTALGLGPARRSEISHITQGFNLL